METWMKVAYAVGLGAMVLFMLPRARAMLQHSPRAGAGDWKAVVIPLIGVILFILFLISMVRH